MARRSRGSTTVRMATGERYWYFNAAYVAAAAFFIGYIALNWPMPAASFGAGAGLFITSGLFVGLGSFVTYATIFKDNSYVRASSSWAPRWWYYFGFGMGAPLLAYFGLNSLGLPDTGLVAFSLFLLTTIVVNVVYLYNRHRYVGIP